jgi:hypothetical protein
MLPPGLVEETLHSLSLILPRVNGKCQKWFEKEQRIQLSYSRLLDPLAADQKPGDLGRSLATYKYWNNRLLEVSKAFDESQPRDISSWWMDRRNTVQWYTFWIAALVLLLTVVFGLIQSITGIIQAYAAYHKD